MDTFEVARLCLVYVIIGAFIRAADDHDGEVGAVIEAEIVHGRAELVRVLGEPFRQIDRGRQGHFLGLGGEGRRGRWYAS